MPAAGSTVASSPGSCSVAGSATGGTAPLPLGCTVARGIACMGSAVAAEPATIVVVAATMAVVVEMVVVAQDMADIVR